MDKIGYGRFKALASEALSPRAGELVAALEADDATGEGGLSPYLLVLLIGGSLDRLAGWASDPQIRGILAGEIFLAYTRERQVLNAYLNPANRARDAVTELFSN